MKKMLAAAMALMMCTVTGCSAEEAQTVSESEETTAQMSANAETGTAYTAAETKGYFNELFLKETLKNGGNFVISPLSAKLALNMAAAGAEEGSATEKELLDLFGYETAAEMKEQSKAVIDSFKAGEGIIETNNSVWVSKKLGSLNKSYKSDLENYFGAESFREDLTSSRFVDKLNSWVNEGTNGLIPQILSAPMDESTRLALVNTLYFKNEWETIFPSYDTYNADFFGTNGTTSVPTMHNAYDMDYRKGKRLKSVILPYTDGSEMRIFLPVDDTVNIGDVISEMSAEELSAELGGKYTETLVDLAMPSFECEYEGSLTEMLKRLGASTAFDPSAASFGNMADTNGEPLYISDVLQGAKIICDEDGTEAAAFTLVETDSEEVTPAYAVKFTVDRPFVYEILSPNGEVLFMGYMGNL